jgi:hypothetical protein
MVNLAMQASLLSLTWIRIPTARKEWMLNFCGQDYHKLLEFFFFVSVPPNQILFSGGRPNQLRWSLMISAL